MGLGDGGPGLGQGGQMGQQRLFPDQADRQKVDQRAVAVARLLGLPREPARVLRPAAEVHQQAMEGGRRGLGRQGQPLGGAQDRALGRVGRGGDMGAKALEARDFRRQVMRRPFAPRGEGARARRRRPERLALIEAPRGPEAEGPRDHGRPVGAGAPGGQIGQRRQRLPLGRGCRKAQLQRREVQRLQRRGAGDQSGGQVVVDQLPAGAAGARTRPAGVSAAGRRRGKGGRRRWRGPLPPGRGRG